MKCIIDTNILVSASLFPNSIPAQAYMKAVTDPYDAVVCDYSIDEMRRVYNHKFPNKIHTMETFLSTLLLYADVIPTPSEDESISDEAAIRDIDDRPILRAAVKYDAQILITGDRDFLESGLTHPKIIKVSDFLNME